MKRVLRLGGIDPAAFESGRHLAAWVGLTPKEHSTGGKQRMGKISRAGNGRLRALFVSGATSVINTAMKPGSRQNELEMHADLRQASLRESSLHRGGIVPWNQFNRDDFFVPYPDAAQQWRQDRTATRGIQTIPRRLRIPPEFPQRPARLRPRR